MTSPNNFHLAESPYPAPDCQLPQEVEIPLQIPKPYMILLLKGCCTEFVSDSDRLIQLTTRFQSRNQPYIIFGYSKMLERYEMIEDVRR